MDIGLLKKNSCISWKDAIAIRMAAYNILIPLLRPARINFQKKLRNSVAKGGGEEVHGEIERDSVYCEP